MSEIDNNGLLSFDWDDDTDFDFGASAATEEKENEVEKDEVEKKEVEEEEEDFFDVEEVSTDEKDKPAASSSIYKDLYEDLKENSIFKHVELEEDQDLDAETFLELQQQEIEAEIEARLQSWAEEELDEDAKAFIKFKRNGGKTADFFKTVRETAEIELGDIEDEDYQDEIIRYQLAKEGWDQEEIEDRLEMLTEKGTKEKFAKKYFSKVEGELEAKKQALIENQAKQKEQAKIQEREFRNTIQETLSTVKDVKGLKFTEEEKGDILNFLTKKSQKIDDNVSITGFQKGLSEVFKDTNKLVLLAKLIKSDFDFSSIEKGAVTKKTREVKTRIEQRQSIKPFGSGSSPKGSLSDLFDK